MHHSRLCSIIIDSKVDDLEAAAKFWSQAIGRPVARTLSFLFPDAVKPLYYGSEELLSAT